MKKQLASNKVLDTETGEITTPEPAPAPSQWKTPFNHDTLAEAQRTATECTEPTLTQASFFEECEINSILKKFGIAQVLATNPGGRFLDIPEDLDMATGFNKLLAARDAWETLPKNVQEHFETIEEFLHYVDQAVERNDRKALEDINLVERLPEPPPAPTPAPTAPQGGQSPPTAASKPAAPTPPASTAT